ncbi:hypothetical protein CON39_11970 [Bacillus thuringiensis]|uniref:DUF5634 family protein n=1 Tax=Bacillus thuringiensis TaxID=1428 RepID=UPI000BEC2E6C|nr:DUF5634 family protein [Bacillus thuringiensis]PEF30381.1 hypothetical protein CON39_11970 [Bacillus thuringiensis]
MTVGVFLGATIIGESINQHVKLMSERLGMYVVSGVLYEEDCTRFGFTVNVPNGLCHISMPYERNEFGDYAILREEWLVDFPERDIKQDGFKTLGDAMDYMILQLLKEEKESEITNKHTIELQVSKDISFVVDVYLNDNDKFSTESIIKKLAIEKLEQQGITGFEFIGFEVK